MGFSVTGTTPYATGPAIPTLQPTLVGQSAFFSRRNTASLTGTTIGASAPTNLPNNILNFITANYALVEGFGPGTQVEVDVNNAAQVLFSNNSNLNPFSSPNTSVTVTQPLFRGRGSEVNLRYIRIANINRKISRLLFYQQLISTVYGVSRLYYDLVSLNENVRVRRDTLAAARKLYEDNKALFLGNPNQPGIPAGAACPPEVTNYETFMIGDAIQVLNRPSLNNTGASYFEYLNLYGAAK